MLNQHKAIRNAGWIIGCRIIQSLLQLAVGMLTARYLGPENYGLISYGASIVAFALPIAQLGLSATLVQEYVENPEMEGEIFGTGIGLNLVCGGLCIAAVILFSLAVNPGEPVTVLVCSLYSLSLIFQAPTMLRCWFQARLKSAYASIAALIAYAGVSVYRLWLLAAGKSIAWFALSGSLEAVLLGGMLAAARKHLGGGRMTFSSKRASKLLKKSRYYILSGLMVTAFQNTDHVMLKWLSGAGENGLYTAAIACVGMTGFAFSAIIDSFRPLILESRGCQFEKYMVRLYSVIFWLSLGQSVSFALLAKPIILVLYGPDFAGAIPVLMLLVWNTAFSYMGAVRNIWILAAEKHSLLWRVNLGGAAVNVALNAFLIPGWGAMGAALASVLTQFGTNVLLGWMIPDLRPNHRLLVKGLSPKGAMELLKEFRIKKEDIHE